MSLRENCEYSVAAESNTVTSPTLQEMLASGVDPWELLGLGTDPADYSDETVQQFLLLALQEPSGNSLPGLLQHFDPNLIRVNAPGTFRTSDFINAGVDPTGLVPNQPVVTSLTSTSIIFTVELDESPAPTGFKIKRGGATILTVSVTDSRLVLLSSTATMNEYQLSLV